MLRLKQSPSIVYVEVNDSEKFLSPFYKLSREAIRNLVYVNYPELFE